VTQNVNKMTVQMREVSTKDSGGISAQRTLTRASVYLCAYDEDKTSPKRTRPFGVSVVELCCRAAAGLLWLCLACHSRIAKSTLLSLSDPSIVVIDFAISWQDFDVHCMAPPLL
jgi:hypothetical protein